MQTEQPREGEALRVSTEDGKYTVIQPESGGLHVLRHGVVWRDCTGDKMVLALAMDLDNARREALHYRQDADAWCRVAASIQSTKDKLARALRWVYKNTKGHAINRPEYVFDAFNEAWEGHRPDDPWRQKLGEPET